MNNLPTSEFETALLALLNALKEYNNALEIAGREGNQLVQQLSVQLFDEYTKNNTCPVCKNEISIHTDSHDVDGQAIEGAEYEKGHNVECPDYKKPL